MINFKKFDRDPVPVKKELLTGTVPVNKEILKGTLDFVL